MFVRKVLFSACATKPMAEVFGAPFLSTGAL